MSRPSVGRLLDDNGLGGRGTKEFQQQISKIYFLPTVPYVEKRRQSGGAGHPGSSNKWSQLEKDR